MSNSTTSLSIVTFTLSPPPTMSEPYDEPSNILEVPLEADGEAVTIDLDNDLPENPSEICVLLENENCAAEYWLAIGTAYARNGQNENAVEVITKGLDSSVVQKDTDRIPFYSCLSWLYLRQLRSAPTSSTNDLIKTKEVYHRLATEMSNKATQLDRSWSVNILARGALTSSLGQFDDSLSSFQTVLNQSNDGNLFAQLGKARVLYQKKNYKSALQAYQNVLLARPNMKPDPRIGIGLCFWKLGDKDGAYDCWARSAELHPKNSSVNTLLGLYFMHKAFENVNKIEHFKENYVKALAYIQDSYKNNSNYSAAGIVLSSYLYSKKSIESLLKLSNKIISYSDLPSLLSDGYFWLGRAYHYLSEYDRAIEYYQLSINKNPASILPLIGKGLVQMSQENSESDALLTFENIVSNHPKSLEAVLLLGILQAKRGNAIGKGTTAPIDPKRVQQAITLLERYVLLAKEHEETPSSEALIVLSQLYEPTNTEKSLSILKQIADNEGYKQGELIENNAHLNNNLGVLYYLNGQYDYARQYVEGALKVATSDDNTGNDNIIASINFNIARLNDAVGEPEKAKEGYNKVLELVPDYIDARIRLTYLSVVLDSETADDGMKRLMDDHDDNLEVRSLYGWYLRRRNRPAVKGLSDDIEQKHHKRSLVDLDKHDCYSLVSLGNLYLRVAREVRINKNTDIERRDKNYVRAAEFFEKALILDPKNAFAAQGVAIIFAETKRPELASYIFTKVKETLNDVSIYINTGHCWVELRQFEKAIESYEYALNRFKNGNDPQLMTLLGRAWYVRGMTEKNHNSLKTALEYSVKALEHSPTNTSLLFNVAFLQFQLADYIRRAPESKRTVAEIEEVAKGLEAAIVSLNEIAKTKYPPFPASELEQRAIMGQNTLRKQLERALAEQEEYDQTVAVKLDEARKRQQVERAKAEQEEKKKVEEREAREQELAEERRKLQEEAQTWAESARLEAEALKMDVDSDDEGGEKKEKKVKGTKKASAAGNGSTRESKREKKEKEKEKQPRANAKKFKSADFIKDSESESELSDLDENQFAEDDEDDDKKRRPSDSAEETSPKKRKLTKRIVDSEDEEDAQDDLFGGDE